MTEDEMVRWHHRLNGHEVEQTLGESEGQGDPACCISWGHRVGHALATERRQRDVCADGEMLTCQQKQETTNSSEKPSVSTLTYKCVHTTC